MLSDISGPSQAKSKVVSGVHSILPVKRFRTASIHPDESPRKERRTVSPEHLPAVNPSFNSRNLHKRSRSSSPTHLGEVMVVKRLKSMYRAVHKRIKFPPWPPKRSRFRPLLFYGNAASCHRSQQVDGHSPTITQLDNIENPAAIPECPSHSVRTPSRQVEGAGTATTGEGDGMQLYAGEDDGSAFPVDGQRNSELRSPVPQYPLAEVAESLYRDEGLELPAQLGAVAVPFGEAWDPRWLESLETDQGTDTLGPADIERHVTDELHEVQDTGSHCTLAAFGTGDELAVDVDSGASYDGQAQPGPQHQAACRSGLQCPDFGKRKKHSQWHECRDIRYNTMEELMCVLARGKYWVCDLLVVGDTAWKNMVIMPVQYARSSFCRLCRYHPL